MVRFGEILSEDTCGLCAKQGKAAQRLQPIGRRQQRCAPSRSEVNSTGYQRHGRQEITSFAPQSWNHDRIVMGDSVDPVGGNIWNCPGAVRGPGRRDRQRPRRDRHRLWIDSGRADQRGKRRCWDGARRCGQGDETGYHGGRQYQ